jgi:hypothetical protein
MRFLMRFARKAISQQTVSLFLSPIQSVNSVRLSFFAGIFRRLRRRNKMVNGCLFLIFLGKIKKRQPFEMLFFVEKTEGAFYTSKALT